MKAPLPTVKNPSWPAGWIDQFILADQEAVGLTPSPEVDRPRLIRRLTLALTGLPPTEDEVLAFVSDSDPQAVAKVVDRLITTRAYAETWPVTGSMWPATPTRTAATSMPRFMTLGATAIM